MTIGGGVGVGVGLRSGVGVTVPGAPGVPGGTAEGSGVTGALVAGGAGGFTCARDPATDATRHPPAIAPANKTARALTR
jgi:hypothetical protein